jgi:polysaccharide biosynthesis PFTS motif protein
MKIRYFKRARKLYIRKLFSGYNILKSTNQLGLIEDIKFELSCTKIINQKKNESKIQSNLEFSEISLRQFVLQHYINLTFHKEIIYYFSKSNNSICYPLPKNWQKILKQKGLRVNKFACTLYWYYEIIKLLILAFFEFISQTIKSIKLFNNYNYANNLKFVYFDSLDKTNVPDMSGEYEFGILSWYLNYHGGKGIDYLSHSVTGKNSILVNNVNVKFQSSPFLPPLSIKSLFQFCFKSIGLIIKSFVMLFLGKWHYALMSKEVILSYVVQTNKNQGIGKNYLFNNSCSIYRPIWTYYAEKYGSKISFYFYSTNIERFKKGNAYPRIANFWHITTWSEYLVWDTFQKYFIDNAIGHTNKTTIVGPIYFKFSTKNLQLPEKTIIIFDVQPVRNSFYITLGLDQEYYVPKIANTFFNHIAETLRRTDFKIAIKKKREIGNLAHISFKHNFDRLIRNNRIINIEPDIPAESIIKDAFAVISMPFTSTAIIAKKYGKPSIYYDPSGIVEKDDRAAHGIPIIQNKNELFIWINSLTLN